ncbi:uncharacterized protein DDB_G0286299-like isoform X1 [Crassostrea angulata]|uniref:uncharacterized protein DDB_G0286299 n=2 Tax=Magallana TaxID=2171616 RepID=UPI0022B1AA47|nr:uncharacterized protein DDB_G0286299-like isoform X1 [Crassostrea angulata]
MFACIFFNEDASLSVVGKNNKSLKLVSDDWEPRGKVEMYWPGKVAGQRSLYHGTIIKVGDEENLNKFATLAYSKILKKQKGLNDVPEELFSFEMSSDESFEKRHRCKTKKMQESEEQEDTLSPKKKKKKDDGKKEGSKENKDEEKEKKKENSSKKQPEKQKKVSKKLEALPEGLRTLQNKYCSDLFGQFSTSVPATLPETDGIFSVSNFNLIDPESTLSEPALPVLKPTASKTPVDPKSTNSEPALPVLKPTASKTPVDPESTPSELALPVLKPTASKTSVEKRSVPLSTSASSLTMTDTWEVCMNAVNATATSDHESMQSLTRPNISAFSQVPIPSGEVLQVLEGLMKPEVQLYIRDLVHFVKQNKPQNSFENTSGDQQSWEQTGHHHDFTAPYRQIESHYSNPGVSLVTNFYYWGSYEYPWGS